MTALTSNSRAHRFNFFAIDIRFSAVHSDAIISSSGSSITALFFAFMLAKFAGGVGHRLSM